MQIGKLWGAAGSVRELKGRAFNMARKIADDVIAIVGRRGRGKMMSIDPNDHVRRCRFRIAATCAAAIECEHGFDVCPTCDPCTCSRFRRRRPR